MRSKNTSRILAVMLSLAVTVPMTQTAYLTTFAQSAASSWSVTAETTGGRLPSHVQSAFEKAMEYIKQSNFELYMKLIQIEYNEAVQ